MQKRSYFTMTTAAALAAALALPSCGKKKGGDLPAGVKTVDGINLVSGDGKSGHFDAVSEHIHLGGTMYGYMDIDGDVEKIADLIGEFLDAAPEGELPPQIERLNLGNVLSDIGIDGIEALGMSSFKKGDLYHNRAFVYVPEGREGIMKLLGGDPGAFVAHSLAPSDTDLVMEQTLNLSAAYDVAMKMVKHFGGNEAVNEMKGNLGEVNPQIGLSVAEVIGKMDTRITVIMRAHPDKPLDIPDAPMAIPSFDLLIALDDASWLYDKVTGNMKKEMPEEQAAQMFVKGDGFERMPMGPMPAPDMVIAEPVIHSDTASKRVYLASSPAFLDECLAGKTKLADSEDFKVAAADLPEEGNGMSYVSADLMKTITGMFEGAVKANGGQLGAQETAIMSLMKVILPSSEHGQAKVNVNLENGILMTSNSVMSMKGGLVASGASFLSAFGAATFSAKSVSPDFDDFPEPPSIRTEESGPPPFVLPDSPEEREDLPTVPDPAILPDE